MPRTTNPIRATGAASAIVFLLSALTLPAVIDVAWRPEKPAYDEPIEIEIRGCTQGGHLHWGVNAAGNAWKQALPVYRPEGSSVDGIATRTHLEGPDDQGLCRIALGPFADTNQVVGSVDFVIQWDDGTWDSLGGMDYHIPITQGRISVEPAAPDINDRITVTVHRCQSGGHLRWGVNADRGRWRRPHGIYWPLGSVPSADGLAVDSPLSAPGGAAACSLTLGPFNHGEQVVTSLHMAVHWGDRWDTDTGRNYNIPISPADDMPGGPRVGILSPAREQSVKDVLHIRVRARGTAGVHLWLDGRPLATLTDWSQPWAMDASGLGLGEHLLAAQSGDGERKAVDLVRFWRVPEFGTLPGHPSDPPGATLKKDKVTFSLYAPGKHFVSVIGDFNNWNPTADVMFLYGDGTWQRNCAVPPGRHEYQYLVDGSLRIADPYSRDVEWKDEAGRETHRPEMARSVIRVGEKPFTWRERAYRRPALSELVIYELFIEDFCAGEGFTGVVARLDHLQDLGVNAIEPLPVTECAGERGWGYNPSFHFAPESGFGTPVQLKELVKAAHERGMAVILDLVLNHMDGNAPLHQLYGLDYDSSPYFHLFLGENWGMPDLDQESPAFKEYADDMLRFWLTEYHADGFRYDATRWVGWNGYNDWGASWFAYAGRQADSNSIHIAEHLPTDPVLMNTTEMDAGWEAMFRWRLRDMIGKAELVPDAFAQIIDARAVGFTSAFQRVVYTESHDEERLFRDLVGLGFTTNEAAARSTLALAVTLTAPGVPMIYAGQELGEETAKVVGPNALHWDRLNDPALKPLYDAARRLVRLRTFHPALRGEHLNVLVNDEQSDTAVYERVAGDQAVLVAVNFGRHNQLVTLTAPFVGTWENVLDASLMDISGDGLLALPVPAGSAVVLSGTRTPSTL